MFNKEKREQLRFHCLHCERGIETGARQRWTAPDGSGHKDLKGFSIYCVADIGHGATYPQFVNSAYEWTGLIPRWCPLIQVQEVEK